MLVLYHIAAFALWIGICAATPEVLWQGLVIFFGHLSWSGILSSLVIGTLLAFFVEPLLERIKHLSFDVGPHSAGPAFLTLPLAILFGMTAVCIHDAISVSFGHDGNHTQAYDAIAKVPEWALVPFVVTLGWFAGRLPRPLSIAAALVAAASIIPIGLAYDWSLQDLLTTAIPALAILAAGHLHLGRTPRPARPLRLAGLTAATALSWCALVAACLALASALGVPHHWIYGPGELAIDARFYAGWVLGILLAPNPDATASHPAIDAYAQEGNPELPHPLRLDMRGALDGPGPHRSSQRHSPGQSPDPGRPDTA